jgi:hypothetical protein
MPQNNSRSLFEKLLYIGMATFFLWPFIQLYSIKAIPLFESDVHLRASIALENIMEDALSKPLEISDDKFKQIPGYEDLELFGKIEIIPHPELNSNVIVKGQVKWGSFPFNKSLSLEYIGCRAML